MQKIPYTLACYHEVFHPHWKFPGSSPPPLTQDTTGGSNHTAAYTRAFSSFGGNYKLHLHNLLLKREANEKNP